MKPAAPAAKPAATPAKPAAAAKVTWLLIKLFQNLHKVGPLYFYINVLSIFFI